MKKFKSIDEYVKWTEQFENASDYEEIPCAIDDGWKISLDMFTACKSWKTAVKRFEKEFKELGSFVSEWCETIRESCENGFFSDTIGWRPAWMRNSEKVKEFAKSGIYSFGVEETSEGYWYIYLNISGVYAGRERETVA